MASARLDSETLPVITKHITQESINLFESCGILNRANIHNDPELAARRLGTNYAIASGRMSIAFCTEAMRKFVGADDFHRSGNVNLKFLRPVKDGDTVTVHGQLINREAQDDGSTLVTVDVYCENQNGDKTAVGQASAKVSNQ
jgi:3-hydroxybutyryl-CoA dehydratase